MLHLSPPHTREIERHARSESPQEACGLLAGRNGLVEAVIPIANVATNPHTAYVMDEREQVEAMLQIQRAGRDLIAIYHSHPVSAPIPSSTDIAEAAYPDAIYLIVGLQAQRANFAAWTIQRARVNRVPVYIGNQAPPPEATSLAPLERVAVVVAVIAGFLTVLIVAYNLLPPAPPIPGG